MSSTRSRPRDRGIEKRSARATLTLGITLSIAACGGIGAGVELEEAALDAGPEDQPACAEEEACAPAIPDGWNGPVALVTGADQPCPDEMPEELFVSHTSLEAAEAACDCRCGSPEGVSCSAPVVLAAREAVCKQEDFFPSLVSFALGASVNVQGQSSRSWATDPSNHPLPRVTGGVCAPAAEVSIPEPLRHGEQRICAPASDPLAGSCDEGGVCSRAAPVCIYHEGEIECPAGPYSERTVSYREIEDTRDCSSCACGPPVGDCDGPVTFFVQGTGTFDVFDLADSCIDLGFTPTHGGHAIAGRPASESAECQPSTTIPTGTAVPADPITTCCLPG